ncbi:hypothetical protein H7X87_00035 [Acetobacteraceae bacterium]|nr:hypothetical protein [Candidatus Parcubacteria bacterium]
MSPLFGKQPRSGKTILLLDIENGSVGGVFARVSPDHAPKLFGEIRKKIRILPSRDADSLMKEIEKAAHEVLAHASEVAARVRLNESLSSIGKVERGAVFLRSPWAHVDFDDTGTVSTSAVDELLLSMQGLYTDAMGDSPVSFHSFGASTGPILHRIFEATEYSLICIMSAEITELCVTDGENVRGYATLPFGSNTIMRTLKAHNGLSDAEAYSLLRLPFSRSAEALHATCAHMLKEFASAAHALLHHYPSRNVFVVAQEPFAHWLAQTLESEHLQEIFTEGGEVRALSQRHVTPYLAAHAQKPDIPLMLASLFADARWGTV